ALRIEDLLGRAQVETDLVAVRHLLEGRRVLVTGAGGSIGAEIARQVAACSPAHLVLLDHDETHLHDVATTMSFPVVLDLADIRDADRLSRALVGHRPDIVFHAAAHKHVPILEDYPDEAVRTNILGTDNLLDAAQRAGVSRFVLISTDKAVQPSSVMGASKRMAEFLTVRAARETGLPYCAVRFGNVLGSRGSVVPTFMRQIEAGGPVTITDARMTRYFMSIPEAVQLVLQAAALSSGGEVFMLDMGEPMRIIDLAKRMIRLSGRRVGTDIEIRVTGTRPGEKLEERLRCDDELPESTAHPSVIRLNPFVPDGDTLLAAITTLAGLSAHEQREAVKHHLIGFTRHAQAMAGAAPPMQRTIDLESGEVTWTPSTT
ncbi:MAG: polysaccharide biosynthesis protein, partial [Cryobacterium sp.]|nr:polysaccharide biosynthesis protein [Cryobacterium sp.]